MRASFEESFLFVLKSIVTILRMWPGRFPRTIIRSAILMASDKSWRDKQRGNAALTDNFCDVIGYIKAGLVI